ncbi:hypothetical protein IWQ61_001347 [Dispira simplex]|nr:hypothetical protein IWQ61_001347 [Dispira simplex]
MLPSQSLAIDDPPGRVESGRPGHSNRRGDPEKVNTQPVAIKGEPLRSPPPCLPGYTATSPGPQSAPALGSNGTAINHPHHNSLSSDTFVWPPQSSTTLNNTISPSSVSAAGPARRVSHPGKLQSTPKDTDVAPEKAGGYPCTQCGLTFPRQHNLKSHAMTHSQERPFSCSICGHNFRRQHDLKRHMKGHTGEKPYICQRCGRGFARMDALSRHSRADNGHACSMTQRLHRQTIQISGTLVSTSTAAFSQAPVPSSTEPGNSLAHQSSSQSSRPPKPCSDDSTPTVASHSGSNGPAPPRPPNLSIVTYHPHSSGKVSHPPSGSDTSNRDCWSAPVPTASPPQSLKRNRTDPHMEAAMTRSGSRLRSDPASAREVDVPSSYSSSRHHHSESQFSPRSEYPPYSTLSPRLPLPSGIGNSSSNSSGHEPNVGDYRPINMVLGSAKPAAGSATSQGLYRGSVLIPNDIPHTPISPPTATSVGHNWYTRPNTINHNSGTVPVMPHLHLMRPQGFSNLAPDYRTYVEYLETEVVRLKDEREQLLAHIHQDRGATSPATSSPPTRVWSNNSTKGGHTLPRLKSGGGNIGSQPTPQRRSSVPWPTADSTKGMWRRAEADSGGGPPAHYPTGKKATGGFTLPSLKHITSPLPDGGPSSSLGSRFPELLSPPTGSLTSLSISSTPYTPADVRLPPPKNEHSGKNPL